MRYYKLSMMCGHVGRGKYIAINFFVSANNKKEASCFAINIPRVKHSNKNVVLSIEEIDYVDYWIGRVTNSLNQYLLCKSKQDQRVLFPEMKDHAIYMEKKTYPKPSHSKRIKSEEIKEKEWRRHYERIKNLI